MHILIINELYRPYGGAEYYLLNVARALEDSGHRVSVLYEEQHQDTVRGTVRPAWRVAGLSRYQPRQFSALRREVDDLLVRIQPDVVYCQYTENYPLLRHIAARWPTVRFVHDATLACYRHWKLLPGSDTWCTRPAGLRCFLAGCTRRPRLKFPEIAAHNRLRRIIVASTCLRDLLIQNGIDRDRLTVLPYFVADPPAQPHPYPSGNPPLVLFTGLVHRIKGPDHFLRALAQLRRPCTAAIVGAAPDPDFLARCHALVTETGLAGRVTFTGWLPSAAVQAYYRRAAVVVMPSIWVEGFGIVGLEAMAHARPVTAYDAGGPRDWLADRETGYLVPRGDCAGLAEKIDWLLAHPDAARAMGAAGRRRYEQLYPRDRHLAGLEQVLTGASG